MEAPDKLYLSHLIYDTFQYQIPDKDDETEIEYVRKDAFIKEAHEWMQTHLPMQYDGLSSFTKAMKKI